LFAGKNFQPTRSSLQNLLPGGVVIGEEALPDYYAILAELETWLVS
jgi:hypothetical protein